MEYIDKNLVFEIVKRVFNLLIEEDKVKSLLPKISNDTPVIYEGFMHDLSDLYKFVNNEYKDKIVNVVLDNIALDNLIKIKEIDLEKEKVENIKKQCPFREVVCSKYQDHPLKCSGACAFVSDRITSEKKHLHNIQNVPVDEERLKMDRRNTV
jgi:hypothetical protein